MRKARTAQKRNIRRHQPVIRGREKQPSTGLDRGAAAVLRLQQQAGNQAMRRLVAQREWEISPVAFPSIQRWALEGPWNIGEPVHEKLTEKALKAAKIIGIDDKYTSKEAWEYIRGALWNDDPEGLLFDNRDWKTLWINKRTTKYSSGAKFGAKFKKGEAQADEGAKFGKKEESLLKRSHFGDLQFLHGMAVKGEKAAKTRANMLKWAEFTYRVGIGNIKGDTNLKDIEVIKDLFPLLQDLTVRMLFCIQEGFEKITNVEKRATGSLLHMIQDTYAASHTEREYKEGAKEIGKIKEFHSYTGQDKKKHSAKDVPSGYKEAEAKAREKGAVDASVAVLIHVKAKDDWKYAKPTIEFILGLVDKPQRAGPGKEFS